jgi:hypothetical protein
MFVWTAKRFRHSWKRRTRIGSMKIIVVVPLSHTYFRLIEDAVVSQDMTQEKVSE